MLNMAANYNVEKQNSYYIIKYATSLFKTRRLFHSCYLRLLVVCLFSYGPTSVFGQGKRTRNCGIDEKGLAPRPNPFL